jgi:hypothetical protein
MKTYLIVLISFITISFSFAQVRTLTDPIPGCDVKVGRKPPGGIIATGKTGADGTYEFKNLSPGKGYFVTVEFGIKEKGIKSKPEAIEINDIEITKTGETIYKNKVEHWGDPHENLNGKYAKDAKMKSMTKDSIMVTVTAGNGKLKVRHQMVKSSINNIR